MTEGFIRLRNLVNLKEIPEMLGINGEYPAGHPKRQFLTVVEKCQKSAIKHSIEKLN